MPRRRIQFILALAAGCQYSTAAQVSTTYLGGGPFGDWYVPGAWSGGVVPINNATTTFAVTVPAGSLSTYPASGRPPVVIDSLSILAGASVTPNGVFRVQQNLLVNGHLEAFGSATITLATGAALAGTGSIKISSGGNVAGFVREGGPLELPVGLTLGSSLHGIHDSFGSDSQPTIIRGTAQAIDSSQLVLNGSTFSNLGTIRASGQFAAIRFNAQNWKFEDIGDAVRENGAAFIVGGVLDNTGRSFAVNGASGRWQIAGTIRGGTIDVAPGHTLDSPVYRSAWLDDTVLYGRMSIGQAGDLHLVDGTLRGNGEVQLFNPVIEGYSQIRSNTSNIRIGSGMTARFTGQSVGPLPENSGIGDPSERKPIFIDGTALSETYPFSITGAVDFAMYGDVTNAGTIQTAPRAGWVIEGDVTSTTGSTFNFALDPNAPSFAPKPMTIHGDFDLRASDDRLVLSLAAPSAYLSEFTIASADQFFGQFDLVSPGFEVFVQGNNMVARVVPEPAMLSLAPAVLVLRRRRVK